MSSIEIYHCQGCGSANAYLKIDSRYGGMRGQCPDCGGNWPES